jgi:hypothetical protein
VTGDGCSCTVGRYILYENRRETKNADAKTAIARSGRRAKTIPSASLFSLIPSLLLRFTYEAFVSTDMEGHP